MSATPISPRPELGNGPLEGRDGRPRDLRSATRPRPPASCSGTWPAATSYRRTRDALARWNASARRPGRPALERGPRGAGLRAYLGPLTRRNLPRARGEFRRRGAEPPGTRPPLRGRHGPRRPGLARPPRRHGRVPGGHGSSSRTTSRPWAPWSPRGTLPRARTPYVGDHPHRRTPEKPRSAPAGVPRPGRRTAPSRRKAEAPILAGRVAVNGETASLGATVTPQDEVTLDGNPVRLPDTQIYLALNKPAAFLRPCATTAAAGPWPT